MKKLIIAIYDTSYDWTLLFSVNKKETWTYLKVDYEKRNTSSDYLLPKPLDKIASLIDTWDYVELLEALKEPDIYEKYDLIVLVDNSEIKVIKG